MQTDSSMWCQHDISLNGCTVFHVSLCEILSMPMVNPLVRLTIWFVLLFKAQQWTLMFPQRHWWWPMHIHIFSVHRISRWMVFSKFVCNKEHHVLVCMLLGFPLARFVVVSVSDNSHRWLKLDFPVHDSFSCCFIFLEFVGCHKLLSN